MKKFLLISAIIITICITFANSYDVHGTEELSYIIAIGIDKSDSTDEPLELSIQIAKPDSSESGGTKIKTNVKKVKCNSFNFGITMLNAENINKINLSHCTAIVISEEVAKEGIGEFINTIANDIEIRPTCNILISQNNASEFLETASNIEDISSKFYSSFISSTQNTSYVSKCVLSNFYSSLHDDIKSPVALYGFCKDDTIETLGLAVFKDYKMVGRTSGLETICFNLLSDNFEEATIEVYNSQNPNTPLCIELNYLKKPKINVKFENEQVKISCDIYVKSKILSGNESYDLGAEKTRSEIESEINKFIENSCTDFLYKTSREFDSDIIGFQGYFNKNFLTNDELKNYDWNELYKNAEFSITSQNYLVSGFLFSKN